MKNQGARLAIFKGVFCTPPARPVEPSESLIGAHGKCQEPDAQFQCWNLRARRVLRMVCVAPAPLAPMPTGFHTPTATMAIGPTIGTTSTAATTAPGGSIGTGSGSPHLSQTSRSVRRSLRRSWEALALALAMPLGGSCVRRGTSGMRRASAPISHSESREVGARVASRGVTPMSAATRVCATWQTLIPDPPIPLRRLVPHFGAMHVT
jgi:hypothetical protein